MIRGAKPVQYREREGLTLLIDSGLLTDYSVAIDGGAHVGTWSEILAANFEAVHSFEPSDAFDYLQFNAAQWPNVAVHQQALCAEPCRVESYVKKRKTLTSRRIRPAANGGIDGITIDSLGLEQCGLIKLDVEGYEYDALCGAQDTIRRCRPFILVELCGHGNQQGHSDMATEALILEMGYKQTFSWGVDFGFSPFEGMKA